MLMSPVTLPISAPIPSKKNNRIVLKNGKNIPSREYRRWHKENLTALALFKNLNGNFGCPVSVNLGISYKDMRRRDLDNSLTSVLDLLKDSGIIVDDDWTHVAKVSAEVISTGESYAIVTISPVVSAKVSAVK